MTNTSPDASVEVKQGEASPPAPPKEGWPGKPRTEVTLLEDEKHEVRPP